jgi:hypothetical protein
MNILAAVALPRPIHGQSIVNAEVVRRLAAGCNQFRVIDTGPGNRHRNVRYHLKRVSRVLKRIVPVPVEIGAAGAVG